MKTLLIAALIAAAPTCSTPPPTDDGGAPPDMRMGEPGQIPPDLSLPEDGLSAPGTCHVPGTTCGVNGQCATDWVCTSSFDCVPICLDATGCPVATIPLPCPAGDIETPFGCFLPCYDSACATGCPQ